MLTSRATFTLVATLALTACTAGGSGIPDDQVYAPGVAPKGEAVDGLIVGGRLMDAGEYELALDAFSRAALDYGMTAEVLSGLGTASLGLGRLGQAEDLLRRAVEQPDVTPEVWNNLGVVLLEKGETAEAVLVLQRAYALDNGETDAIRDNLRKALAKSENPVYDPEIEQNYKLVRRGGSDYLIRAIP